MLPLPSVIFLTPAEPFSLAGPVGDSWVISKWRFRPRLKRLRRGYPNVPQNRWFVNVFHGQIPWKDGWSRGTLFLGNLQNELTCDGVTGSVCPVGMKGPSSSRMLKSTSWASVTVSFQVKNHHQSWTKYLPTMVVAKKYDRVRLEMGHFNIARVSLPQHWMVSH